MRASASHIGRRTPPGRLSVRFALGVVLVGAGTMKLAHPAIFFADLLAYHVPLPEAFFRLAAVTVPWLEVICGVALLFDFWPETVRPLVAALSLVFVGMLLQALVRGLDLDCGCLGPGLAWTRRLDRPPAALARAILVMAASLYLLAATDPVRIAPDEAS